MKKLLVTASLFACCSSVMAQVGINTASPASTLDVNGSVSNKTNIITTSTVLDDTYNLVLCNNSSSINVTLPTASGIPGRMYVVKRVNNGGVTIQTTSSQTIDGAASLSLSSQNDLVSVVSNGTNWNIVGALVSSSTVAVSSSLTGDGSGASPLAINLTNANSWSAAQTFGGGATVNNSNLAVSNSNNTAGEVRFAEPSSSGSNYTAIKAQAQSSNITYTLPSALPSANGEVLTGSTSGALSWATASSGSSSPQFSYATVSSNTTLNSSHQIVGVNTSGGAVTITLPLANSVSAGRFFFIDCSVVNANGITFAVQGSDLINGSATSTVGCNAPNSNGAIVYSNGVNGWFRLP